MKTVAETPGVSRSHLTERGSLGRATQAAQAKRLYRKRGDPELLEPIRRVVDARPTYGYRRVSATIDRERAAPGLIQDRPQAHLPRDEAGWASAGAAHRSACRAHP